ncbi:hypothetical protein LB535_18380 [Mesorhizobium sp. CA10]|uniref:hypothetical protein n=1 Tax=Mesorhizobium sp. CA10 TaxID=588495 RepID=UPI001CCF7EF1|nr:hypothetical protein [Mesorhizobium sp. CA10]MBZ9884321.1 hypothetical protein [Mesorhizobium sp. CA10]
MRDQCAWSDDFEYGPEDFRSTLGPSFVFSEREVRAHWRRIADHIRLNDIGDSFVAQSGHKSIGVDPGGGWLADDSIVETATALTISVEERVKVCVVIANQVRSESISLIATDGKDARSPWHC